MIDYPNELDIIFDKLKKNNIKPIIVGGYIRDTLLHINPNKRKDIDIELYNLESFEKLELLLSEFGELNSVGKSFGVCKLTFENIEIDFSLPRLESKVSPGHKGFEIKIQKDISFQEAASRRDFTINSLGYDVSEKKLLDPFGGVEDLQNKLLRATSKDTFMDDPLRILRAVQFCARFHLHIDSELQSLILSMMQKNLLDEISHQRIHGEIEKLFLKSPTPSKGFQLIKELKITNYFYELNTIIKTQHFFNMLDSIDYFAQYKLQNDDDTMIVFLCIICSYFEDETTVKSFLEKCTYKTYVINYVLKLLTYKTLNINLLDEYSLLKLAPKIKLNLLLSYFLAKNSNTPLKIKIFTLMDMVQKLGIQEKGVEAYLKGKDLVQFGLKPSKEFKTILDDAYDLQLKHIINSHQEALQWMRENF